MMFTSLLTPTLNDLLFNIIGWIRQCNQSLINWYLYSYNICLFDDTRKLLKADCVMIQVQAILQTT